MERIHYITDRPFCQYRNKVIFFVVANHQEVFGVQARWDNFEAGHEKGPCDSIDGTVKRMAEQASKHGTAMSDADNFFPWASQKQGAVKFTWVGTSQYKLAEKGVSATQPQLPGVKGSLKLHAVQRGDDGSHVLWREIF